MWLLGSSEFYVLHYTSLVYKVLAEMLFILWQTLRETHR